MVSDKTIHMTFSIQTKPITDFPPSIYQNYIWALSYKVDLHKLKYSITGHIKGTG